MGTLPAHEGRGLGSALLRRALADLRAAGESTVVISWIGPEGFYRRELARCQRVGYVFLRKEIGRA
jgi:predicted N-acetyltransferase YhbS